MNEIPEPLIPTAEKLSAEGSIRVNNAPEEMHLLRRMGFAEIVKKFGPEPPQPNRSRKAAHDLRAGDILVEKVHGFEQFYKIEEVAHRPDGVHVKSAGEWLPVVYRSKAEVSDGFMREQETWQEYQLNAGGQDALALLRLTANRKGKRTGRPRKGETDKNEIVVAALAKHHEYESGGSIGNWEPATVRGLASKPDPTTAAISRFLKSKFPDRGYKGYATACRDRSIGRLLAKWQHDVPEGHVDLRPEEYGRQEDD